MKKIILCIILICGLLVIVGCSELVNSVPLLIKLDIHQLLEEEGLELACIKYEQLEVLRWNVTCNRTGSDFYMNKYDYVVSTLEKEKTDCGWYDMLKREAVIVNINGDCLVYDIVRK